ncbi:MAG: hypothetical protein HPY73_00240 [Methanomassiliicoccales archaeon]|nr:MAG: hypothetical protein HPY73_00240 [Methanomassiliicoccales archaeon]
MENRSGFKECSRCGLRNKPTAKQCDFCGQKFDQVDEWELQIDALEKLSKETRQLEVTEDLSKKIEATIVKKEPVGHHDTSIEKNTDVVSEKTIESVAKERETIEPPEVRPVIDEEKPNTTVTFTATEPAPEEVGGDATVVEPSSEIVTKESVVADEALPIMEIKSEPAPENILESGKDSPPLMAERPEKRKTFKADRLFKWRFDPKNRKSVLFMSILLAGVVLYITSIMMSSTLGILGAWSIVVVSGLMVVTGISQLAIDWSPAHLEVSCFEEMIEICPECNERVYREDERCPACGTEFEPSEQK